MMKYDKFAKKIMDVVNIYQLHLARSFKYFDIGLSDYGVLLHLYHRPDILICQNDIAQSQKRDKALVARSARKLEQLGYIYFLDDPNHKLKKNLFLTEKGKAIVPQIKKYIAQWEDEVLADFSAEELVLFQDLFERIHTKSEGIFRQMS